MTFLHAIHIICKIPTRKISDIYKLVIKKLFKIGSYHICTFAIWMKLTSVQVLSRFEKFWCFIIRWFSDSHSSCNAVFTSFAFSINLSPLGKISDIIALQPFFLHFFFAKSIMLLAIPIGSNVDLQSLLPICKITLFCISFECWFDVTFDTAVVAPEKCITFTLLFLLFSNLENCQLSTCFIVESPSMTMLSFLISFFSKLFLTFDIFCNSTLTVVVEFSKLTIAMPLSSDFLNYHFYSIQIYCFCCLLIVSLQFL